MTTAPTCYKCGVTVGASVRHCKNCGVPLLIEDRYRILSDLGSGGFGVVLKVRDLRLDRLCALKVINHARIDQQEQIRIEVDILSKHAQTLRFIPAVYDFWGDKHRSYLVIEFVEGSTLDQTRALPWPVDEVEAFLRELLADLHELHSRRIVHRDLKPQNIMRQANGHYMLIDFGISKYGEATMRGAKAASLNYAPPEQFKGTTDGRSDLYSLGATAYLLLTGQLIPDAFIRAKGTTIAWPSELGLTLRPEFERTLQWMLELDPAQRPPGAREALAVLTEERVRPLPPPVFPPPPPAPPARNKYLLPASLTGGVAAGGLALALFLSNREPSPPTEPTVTASAVAGQQALLGQGSGSTATPTLGLTPTVSPTPTAFPTLTATPTAFPILTATPTAFPTLTATPTAAASPTLTAVPTLPATPTLTPELTRTTAPTATTVREVLPPLVGERVPMFTLSDANDKQVALKQELQDHRIVVLIFYYSDT